MNINASYHECHANLIVSVDEVFDTLTYSTPTAPSFTVVIATIVISISSRGNPETVTPVLQTLSTNI
jgi:hypothetical protein